MIASGGPSVVSGALSTFTFKDQAIRVIDREGNPWFVAQDICHTLSVYIRPNGSVNTTAAMDKLAADEKEVLPYQEAKRIGLQQSASRAHGLAIISEAGLYRLIMRSDKPEARAFQDWVTRDVLPAIRKDGAYLMGEVGRPAGDTAPTCGRIR